MSTLHARIRFLEYFLHLAYRLEVRKWQIHGADVQLVKERKKNIQQKFKDEMGLLVDQPRPGGVGTSNTANTSRIFFSNPTKSAEITDLYF